jgi:GNAT superfamily N-acetyltransferase
MADYGRHLARSLDGRIDEWNGVVLCGAGLASQYRNLAVPLWPPEPGDLPELGQQLAKFYPPDARWVVWSAFPDDLSAAGLRFSWTNPTMYRQPGQPLLPEAETPADFIIEEVTRDAEMAVFERVRNSCYPRSLTVNESGLQLDSRVLGNGMRHWVGRIGAEVVATAAAYDNGDLNVVKNISTLKRFRRQGIGAAMSVHAVNSSPRPATLDADPDGRRLYQRLGFREAGAVRFWNLPD